VRYRSANLLGGRRVALHREASTARASEWRTMQADDDDDDDEITVDFN
jgi:hypothetical protein